MTTDLAAFLQARIAEDEAPNRAWFTPEPDDSENCQEWTEWSDACARSWHTRICGWRLSEGISENCNCGLPARVLADCKARREIVELHPLDHGYCEGCGIETQSPDGCLNLRLLAIPYADHADYRAEWAL